MGGASEDPFKTQIASDDSTELFRKLLIILKALRWNVIVPNTENENDYVKGLIVGTPDYVNKMSDLLTKSGL